MLKRSLSRHLYLSGLFLFFLPSIGIGQNTIFSEDFDGYSNGATSDAGRWYSTPSGSENYFEVRNGRFEGDGLNGESTWESDTFDISSCDSVRFSLDAIDADDLDPSDYFDVYYSTDGGASYNQVPDWNGLGDPSHTLVGDKPDPLDWGGTNSYAGGSVTISKNGITGSSFILRVVMNNDAEVMALDNVSIEGYSCTSCHQLFVNEFSNGESGVREYVELIVGNDCGGCYADLSGWIIDDNNGEFSGGPSTGEGIAQGHLRFDPNADWDSIPTGSIIVIYNASDKNLTIDNLPLNDDPMDSNGDSVYVIPSDDPDIQECSGIPNTSDGSYSPCSYSSSSSWSAIAMSNSQDAMQTRKPNGDYFHGASYGSDAAFDGGPDGLHVHNSGGSDDVFYFGGSDPRDPANWSQGDATNDLLTTEETPGSSNNSNNGTYIDGLACNSSSGCVANASFTVNDSTQCASANSFDLTNTGSSSGFDHSWQFGDGQSASLENPTYSDSDSGSYEIRLITDSASSCADTAYKTVVVGTVSTNLLPADTLNCSRSEDTLDASSSIAWPGNPSYSWTSSNGNILSGSNTATPVIDDAGTYELVLSEDSIGCSSVDTVELFEDPDDPNASFSPQPSEGEVPLEVDLQDQSSNSDSYFWDLGDGDSAFVPSPSHTYEEKGRYTVRLRVSNARGCVDSTTHRFIIVEEPFEWEVPNVFSPNGDGKNDRFRVDAQNVGSFVGRIYNRWGQKLHQWEKIEGGWDGTTPQGREAPEGSYFFDLRVIDKEGKEHTRRGELTLFR